MTDQALPPPGWYSDPGDDSTRRYWDGGRWTESRAPIDKKAADRPAGALAYAAAVAFPIGGVILSIIQFARSNTGHGAALLLTSIVAAFIWMMILGAAWAADYDSCINDARNLAEMSRC